MRPRFVLLTILSLIMMAGSATAETVAGLPLHVQKFDTGAIRVWIGDHISSTATVAIPTKAGVVIIDTTGNPEVDRELRRVIGRELGRDDFAMLINTHEHRDHTGGNAVYADCTIIGHELVAAGMSRQANDSARITEWLANRVVELEKEIAQLPPDAPEAARLNEDLILDRLELKVAKANLPLVPPTKTFADQLVLDLDDTTFELYYIGGMHSASDIAIFVPEHGLLMTGDTMADIWLTDTPGCLASFVARSGVRHDFPLLLKNWNLLLAKRDGIKKLIPGHWNGELTFAGFEARVKYVEDLWQGAAQITKSGGGVGDLLTGYRLDTRFPALVESPGCGPRNNYMTIVEIWTEATGQRSAAQAIYELIDQGADESAIQRIVAQHGEESPSHFFLENEINGHGYRLLQHEQAAQAVKMFQINVELFPQSWNVHDSLGEALLAAGDSDAAVVAYERSLELNPENTNGKEVLDRIRSGATVN